MLLKNVAAQGFYLFAYDTTNKVAKTGDAANITGHVSKDGGAGASFGTANPTEIGGGVYWQPLAQAETNANAVAMYWASATSGVQIDPVIVLTTGANIPTAAPGASGGLPTLDASLHVASDAKAINAVSTSPVTTIAAVIGTAQAISFASVNGTQMPKVDIEGVAGAGASTFTGTAQAGTANTITLAAGETNNPQGREIALVGGTGSGQSAVCIAYNGTSKVATIYCPQGTGGNWATNPDATTEYAINSIAPAVDATGNAFVKGPFKANTAAGFSFRMVQSSDNKTGFTAGGVTGTRTIAGGASGAVAGTITQIGTTSEYYFSGAAADFNGAEVHFAFTATNANPVYVTINTTP